MFDHASLLLIPKLYRENVEPRSLMRGLYPLLSEHTSWLFLGAMTELRHYYGEQGLRRWRNGPQFPLAHARMLCQFKSFYKPKY